MEQGLQLDQAPSFPFDIGLLGHRNCCAVSCATSGVGRIVLVVTERENSDQTQAGGEQKAAADNVVKVIGTRGLAGEMQSRFAVAVVVVAASDNQVVPGAGSIHVDLEGGHAAILQVDG